MPGSVILPGGRGSIEGASGGSIYGEQLRNRQTVDEASRWIQHKWEDLRVPMNSFRQGGVADPDWVSVTGGLYLFGFDAALEEETFFVAQLPHAYEEGTNIRPHIHWMPADATAGSVRWGLEYSWVNVDGVLPAATTIYCLDPAAGLALDHQICSFEEINGTEKTISSMLVCRLFRDATDGTDTYAGDALVLEFDFHYLRNTNGSEEELAKYGSRPLAVRTSTGV